MGVKLLHAADLHVDSPLRGLSDYDGAPADQMRTATREALTNLVDLARAEAVDAVLLAGDIYDGDWPDFNTGLFFSHQMSRLRQADIKVFLVSGNHDAQNKMTRDIPLPENVYRMDTAAPQTIPVEAIGVAVHGQGFARRDVTENLAASYPAPLAGLVNVGLLHTALTGAEGHDSYAPCSVEQLAAKGYDYWALGHVHKRREVSTDPWIVFPGNTQGRHAGETGPKGCTLIAVDDGRVTAVEHRDLDTTARWAHLEVDVSSAADLDDACELVRTEMTRAGDEADGRLLAVRVSLRGRTAAHAQLWGERDRLVAQVRSIATDLAGIWVEKVRPATQSLHASDLASDLPDASADEVLGVVTDLRRTADQLRIDGDALRRLVEGYPLMSQLPAEARNPRLITVSDEQWLGRIFDEAVDLLVAMVDERVGERAGERAGEPR